METDDVMLTGGPLKPHEYVLVKPYMTAGDERWIQNHAAKTRSLKSNNNDNELTMTIGDIQFATFQRMVKGWKLYRRVKRPDGEILELEIPFDVRSIEELPRTIYRFVLRKIDELNPADEESDESFLTGATAFSGTN